MTNTNRNRRTFDPDESGVAAIFFGLAITVLIAGLGLSVDIGNVAYQRNNAQHAADLAARTLAISCAKSPTGAECQALDASAMTIASQSLTGGDVDAEHTPHSGKVRVTVRKDVQTPLLGWVGVGSKTVEATAVASGGGHAHEGYPTLPLGVSYCTWKNNAQFAGTPAEATHKTAIRTDTLQSLRTMLSPLDTSALRGLVDVEGLQDYLGTKAVDMCTDEDGRQIGTFKGAVWITGETVVSSITKGLFGWDASKCQLRADDELSTFLGGLQGAATRPPGCPSKFGNGKPVDVGNTIMMPIFKPYSTLQSDYGLKLASVCAGLLGSNASCVEVPPKLGVEIVGFAPFHITGWTYPGGKTDTSVGCQPIGMSFNLRNVLLSTLSLLELIANLGLKLVNGLLGSDLEASIGCNGLQGYFTKTFTKDPNFEYGGSADEFGAQYIRLTQ